MNRFFRRLQQFGKSSSERRPPTDIVDTSGSVNERGTPQEVSSVRAKNEKHRKVTADKWNQ